MGIAGYRSLRFQESFLTTLGSQPFVQVESHPLAPATQAAPWLLSESSKKIFKS
jgi:hypothetical protein